MSKLLLPAVVAAPLVFPIPAIVHMQAYANGLTSFIPTLYDILDIVSRELVGFIPSVTRATGMERVAKNQVIQWPKSTAFVLEDTVEQMTVAEPSDRTPGLDTMKITKSKMVSFKITGEDQLNLGNSIGWASLRQSDFAQALRVLCNAIEFDLAVEAYQHGSRATGVSGTTPFATNLSEGANVVKILDDNGAPQATRSFLINTATAGNMRTLGQLSKVNEAGSEMTLRDGEIGDLFGMSIKQSGQLKGHTKGTNSGSTTNAAGYAIGSTVITLAAAGTGTHVAGDVITFAGDTNQYVVVSGDADVSNGGTITIAEPGLLVAIPASATLITTTNSYMQNVAFTEDSMRLMARPPAVPQEGDARIDEYLLQDPRSGLTFEVSVWAGQRMVAYQVALAWGVKAVKQPHIALLKG